MKILHCLAQSPAHTGSGIYYRNLIRQIDQLTDWQQAGLYGLNHDQIVNGLPLDQVYPVQFETTELPFPIVGMSDEMPYRSTIYHQMTPEMIGQWRAAFSEQLLQLKCDFSPDVIICHHLWYLCSLIHELYPDTPIIGISHGTDIRQAIQHPGLLNQYVTGIDKLEHVLALSNRDLPELTQLFGITPERILVTGGAYDPEVFYPPQDKPSSSTIRLLNAGKLTDAKGIFELIEAYMRLHSRDSQLELHLVGRTSELAIPRLNQLIQDDPTIHLYEPQPQAQLAEHMRQCDLFVFPSYYEGLGLTAMEALATGLHLVSNKLPGLMEQLGDDLIHDAVITWVDLPSLQQLDQLAEDDREDYIDRLAEAMTEQIKRLRENDDRDSFPYEKIRQHSWHNLSARVIGLIETLFTKG